MVNARTGFTLIELMIVIAIISIIAGIAIPNLLRSKMSANEASATGGMRTISTGEIAYQAAGVDSSANGTGNYATLTALGTGVSPFIDSALSTGTKSGYSFEATPIIDPVSPQYTSTATPLGLGRTGLRTYFVDESGVIRVDNAGGTPSSTSPPLN